MDMWGPERAGDLAALLDDALPAEHLTADELEACCWDGWPSSAAVLALSGGEGAVAVGWTDGPDGRRTGVVRLIAVLPAATGEGRGRALLDAGHEWLFDAGAASVVAAGLPPSYLWPGVDVRATRAMCLAESAGYREVGAALNLSFPSTFRARVPEGFEVRRVLDDADAGAVLELCAGEFGGTTWVAEAGRGIEHGACHAAVETATGRLAAFACHSVNRAGWFGPTGTDPAFRRRGVGAALLSACATDLAVAGYPDVEVAWIGPFGFYARTAGAAVSRVFRLAVKARP